MTRAPGALLQGPIVPTLLRMAWPNILVMVAQASTGLIETWFVAKLGTDALAGMALVFPGVMMMQMISAGAMGGGISSADRARARRRPARRGRRAGAARADHQHRARRHRAPSSCWRSGGRSIARSAARAARSKRRWAIRTSCSPATCCSGCMNGFASVIRGTGNMLVPASVICAGVVVLVPLSPVLIFGLGPFPALGIAGGGVALLVFYAAGTARARLVHPVRTQYRALAAVAPALAVVPRHPGRRRRRGRSPRCRPTSSSRSRPRWSLPPAAPQPRRATAPAARLEYLLIPLVFGLGAPLVAMVGTNIGAGQRERALRIAMAGGAVAFVITEAVGHRRGGLAARMDLAVQRRPAHARGRRRLSAHRRADLRILRPRRWRSISPRRAPGGCSGR